MRALMRSMIVGFLVLIPSIASLCLNDRKSEIIQLLAVWTLRASECSIKRWNLFDHSECVLPYSDSDVNCVEPCRG